MITYCCSFYQVPAYCMQMMNYHKVEEQDRIKFELYMLLIVIEESYNNNLAGYTFSKRILKELIFKSKVFMELRDPIYEDTLHDRYSQSLTS